MNNLDFFIVFKNTSFIKAWDLNTLYFISPFLNSFLKKKILLRKRPLDTPERNIERRERGRERLPKKHTVMTETHSDNGTHSDDGNTQWWQKHTAENITRIGDKKLF